MFAETDGKVFGNADHEINVFDRTYFKACMQGEYAIEKVESSLVDQKPKFIVVVPAKKDEKIIGAIIGECAPQSFVNSLISEAYGAAAYSFVCDENGNVIIASKHESYLVGNTNLLEFFANAKLLMDSSKDQVISDLKSKTPGFIVYEKDDEQRYAAYQPLGINGWMLFNAVPGEIINAKVTETTKTGYILIITIGVIALLLISIVLWLAKRNGKYLQEERERIQASDERFRLAMQNTTITIWDYDFRTRSIIQTDHSVAQHGFETIIPNVPESLIECGFVHQENLM